MALTASFEVDVSQSDTNQFASLSGDYNPLHVDSKYASSTTYRAPILHGAFSAGLISRLAGMQLPGQECLLHGIRLRFLAPIVPPKRLIVSGKIVRGDEAGGTVEVAITDAVSGVLYVSGAYDFGNHALINSIDNSTSSFVSAKRDGRKILVTGATGGLGAAVLAKLGDRGLGVTRSAATSPGMLHAANVLSLREQIENVSIEAIIHCGWPEPDNQRLFSLSAVRSALQYHLTDSLAYVIELGQLLADRGEDNAMLVLIGSTAANPGRHAYRMPIYSMAKAALTTLTKVLALELGIKGKRCLCLNFDVIVGGMNASISRAVRLSHEDRSPWAELATPESAAEQIMWALSNSSHLASGAVIEVSGGSLP